MAMLLLEVLTKRLDSALGRTLANKVNHTIQTCVPIIKPCFLLLLVTLMAFMLFGDRFMHDFHIQLLIKFALTLIALVIATLLVQHNIIPWIWPDWYAQVSQESWFRTLPILMMLPARSITQAFAKRKALTNKTMP